MALKALRMVLILYPRVRGADDENRDYLEKDVPLPPRARG